MDSNGQVNNWETNGSIIENKRKKSLFALIKRKKKKPKVHITKEIQTYSTIKYDSESVTSDIFENSEVSSENKHCFVEQTDSEVSSIKSKPKSILKKIINKTRFHDKLHPKNSTHFNNLGSVSNISGTSYLPGNGLKVVNKINELYDILNNLHQREDHIVGLLKKYILDKKFQKQLLQTSSDYFSAEHDCKYNATTLTNTMWLQQLQMTKAQEQNLQQRLNFVVKQNRNLQIEVETLTRKCEKYGCRKNVFPKYFLHLRSFGKKYISGLINNNRQLQSKLKKSFEIIQQFETDLQSLQKQNGLIELEKEKLNAKLTHSESFVERVIADEQLERASMSLQIESQRKLIKKSENAGKILVDKLNEFDASMKEMTSSWKPFQYKDDGNLPELINQLHPWIGNFITGLITTCNNETIGTKDINKLRETNARLQENLQKATNELDNVSKNLEKTKKAIDRENMEVKANLEQEISTLRSRLDLTNENNKTLKEQLESKDKMLQESSTTINNILVEKCATIPIQIHELVRSISQSEQTTTRPMVYSQEKVDSIRAQYNEILSQKKIVSEKCQELQEVTTSLQQKQEELTCVHEELNNTNAENEVLKKQLEYEHQIIIKLQQDRIKYVEERNILKVIFQNLKGEITRAHDLEGTVGDLAKETSRLSAIAELNKQISDQLKNEVEMKNNTILELRQSLEHLNHTQMDNNKEKLSLCSKLSEIEAAKEKLNDYLEMEIKKNLQLGESRKQLEFATKSQIKIFEEMQKSERAALQELLENFRTVVKQRDSLLKMEERYKKKNKEFEMRYEELKKVYVNAANRITEKDEEIKITFSKLQQLNETTKKMEETTSTNNAKYEKMIKKLEKLVAQMRKDKDTLESSNEYLKTNLQKIQNDFNETRENHSQLSNDLTTKEEEQEKLREECETYRNNNRELTEENDKLKSDLEYLNKVHDKQTSDVHNILAEFSSKGEAYIETKSAILDKEQEISQLNKTILELECSINFLKQECEHYKKINEDQNKILIGYENQLVYLSEVEKNKLKADNEVHNLQIENSRIENALETATNEIDNLKSHVEDLKQECDNAKFFHKNETQELIFEYTEHKENIEDEIHNISLQLREVTNNLNTEKLRFDQLFMEHEDLKRNFSETKCLLEGEKVRHAEFCTKIEHLENKIIKLKTERDNLQMEIHSLVVDLNEERDGNVHIANEKMRLQTLLEQGRQQFGLTQQKIFALESELISCRQELESKENFNEYSYKEIQEALKRYNEKSRELEVANETMSMLNEEMEQAQNELLSLKEELFIHQKQVTELEFKNCELTLQLHEAQCKLETEKSLYEEMKMENENNLKSMQMVFLEDGSTVPSEGGDL